MIEALGVPHTEIDLILVNGESVDFLYSVKDTDYISIYPPFESLDISPLSKVRPHPLGQFCFILDTHLGKLSAYLRLLGFDTLYRNNYKDEELADLSREGRILLTRDVGLLKRSIVTHGYWLRETNLRKQLIELFNRFDLLSAIAPFQRCIKCNGLLKPIQKEAINDRLLPKTKNYYNEFHICPSCNQIYWKGSHYERMQQFIGSFLDYLIRK